MGLPHPHSRLSVSALTTKPRHTAVFVSDEGDVLPFDARPGIPFAEQNRRWRHERVAEPPRRSQQHDLARSHAKAVAGHERDVAPLTGEQIEVTYRCGIRACDAAEPSREGKREGHAATLRGNPAWQQPQQPITRATTEVTAFNCIGNSRGKLYLFETIAMREDASEPCPRYINASPTTT